MWLRNWVLGTGFVALVLMSVSIRAADAAATQPETKPAGLRLWSCSDEEYAVFNALLTHLYVDHKQTALTGDGNRIGGVGPVINQVVLVERTLDLRMSQGDPAFTEEEDRELLDAQGELEAPRLLKECPKELNGVLTEGERHDECYLP